MTVFYGYKIDTAALKSAAVNRINILDKANDTDMAKLGDHLGNRAEEAFGIYVGMTGDEFMHEIVIADRGVCALGAAMSIYRLMIDSKIIGNMHIQACIASYVQMLNSIGENLKFKIKAPLYNMGAENLGTQISVMVERCNYEAQASRLINYSLRESSISIFKTVAYGIMDCMYEPTSYCVYPGRDQMTNVVFPELYKCSINIQNYLIK